jgi:hypothetical protein
MCYVRYAHDNIHDNSLFCRILPTRTGEEIFHTLDSYIRDKGIQWEKCALTGKHSGVVSEVKEVAPDMNWVHCFIRREALDFKGMPPEFKTVLDNAVKLINYIKAHPLNNRLFSVLCDEMGSEYTQLCFVLKFTGFPGAKLFQLRHEVLLFVNDSASLLVDEAWLLALSHLSDIFSKLNELNLSSGDIFSGS